jgi:hypothetical protein
VDATISITPPTATNEIGHPHTFTVTLKKDLGDGNGFVVAAGEHVDFTLTDSLGANSTLEAASSTCDNAGANTDAGGQCTIVFTSNSVGKVTGHATSTLHLGNPAATVTVATDGVGQNSGDAVKTFVDANIQITPATATNPLNTNHVLTGHVNVNLGAGGGYVNAPDGTTINFSILSGPGSFVGPNSCTTAGGTGSCTVTITSSTTGLTTIRASTDVTVSGVLLHRATGDANVGDSADASKLWASAKITIAPSATNEVGQPHTFTVTLSKDSGNGFVAAPNEHVDVTLTDSNGASHSAPTGSCTTAGANTDANGQCTITFTSGAAGTVTGHATSTLNVGGTTITVSTSGAGGNSGDAVKTFVDANIQITPTSAINPIGTNHTLTGHGWVRERAERDDDQLLDRLRPGDVRRPEQLHDRGRDGLLHRRDHVVDDRDERRPGRNRRDGRRFGAPPPEWRCEGRRQCRRDEAVRGRHRSHRHPQRVGHDRDHGRCRHGRA